MDPEAIRADEAFAGPWYYSIELAPGLYTDGAGHRNVAVTRELLKNVDIETGGGGGSGATCLDVGTQEALVTMLLERRGGSVVVGYDRVRRDARLELVRKALNPTFEFVGGMPLSSLHRALSERGHGPFDVVVFSGVLYHMFDPLGGLATVRGLVRTGGILVVESWLTFDDAMVMHLNSQRRFGPFAIWLMSVPCLDYLLRFLRLEPLDVAYLRPSRARGGTPAGRVAVACRAVADAVPEPGDEWMSLFDRDFSEFLDWDELDSAEPPVGYRNSPRRLLRRPSGTIDLAATLQGIDPHEALPEQVALAIDAVY